MVMLVAIRSLHTQQKQEAQDGDGFGAQNKPQATETARPTPSPTRRPESRACALLRGLTP